MTPHDLLANFEVLAEASNGIQRLRELVLELAVRGKLVEQDPEDEPARELLKRIQTALGKGLAAKRAKGRKAGTAPETTSGIDAEGKPLPQGWSVAPLADLIELMDAGWSPACSGHITSSDAEWGILKTTAVQANSYEPWYHKALPQPLSARPECEVLPGDLLVTRAGPWFRVGVCCFVSTTRPRLMLSDKIIRCRLPQGLLDGCWIALCINSGKASSFLRAKQTGMDAAQVNISQGRLASAPIEIPPLPEQRRIVARVNELMALLDRLEAMRQERETARAAARDSALAALRDAPTPDDVEVAWLRVQDRFQDLFTTPEDIEPLHQAILQLAVRGRLVTDTEWVSSENSTLGGFVDFLNGYAFKSEWYVNNGIQVVRNANVGHGKLNWSDRACISSDQAADFARFFLTTGDIVITLDRPIISTGVKVARIIDSDLPCLLLQRVAKPTIKHPGLDPDFLFLWFTSPEFIEAIDPGRSNGVPHISTREIGNIPFRLMSAECQRISVSRATTILVVCNQLRTSLVTQREHAIAFSSAAVHHLDM